MYKGIIEKCIKQECALQKLTVQTCAVIAFAMQTINCVGTLCVRAPALCWGLLCASTRAGQALALGRQLGSQLHSLCSHYKSVEYFVHE